MWSKRFFSFGAQGFVALSVVLLLFATVLPRDRIFCAKDIGGHYIAIKANLADALRNGELPLWIPTVGCGFPLLAESNTQAFYPSSFLLLFLSPAQALKLQVLLHFLGMALAGAVLARHFGVSRRSALLGGLIFMGSGAVVSMHWNVMWHAGLPWGILAIALIHKLIEEQPRPGRGLGLSICIAMQALAGAFEVLLALAVFSLFAWLFALLQAMQERFVSPTLADLLARGIWMAGAATLGGCLAAMQILPTLELLQASVRAHSLTPFELSLWSLPPGQLLEMLAPGLFGAPGTGNSWTGLIFPVPGFNSETFLAGVYLGVPALSLALAGLASSIPWRHRLLLAGMALCLILLSLGDLTALLPSFQMLVPGVRSFRYPAKFLALAMVPLGILAALGHEGLLRKEKRAEGIIVWSALLLSILPCIGFLAVWLFKAQLISWLAAQISRTGSSLEAHSLHQGMLQALAHGAGIGGAWLVLLHLRRSGGRVPEFFCLALPVLDLALTNAALVPWAPESSYQRPSFPLPRPEAFHAPSGTLRIGAARHNTRTPLIEPFLAAVWGYNIADKYGAMELGIHPRLGWILGENEILRLRLSSVALAIVKAGAGMKLIPVENPMPRASLIPGSRIARSNAELTEFLRSTAFDPRKTVILELATDPGPPPPSPTEEPALAGSVILSQDSPQEIRLQVEATRPAFLLLTDSWYPGWTASVDGQPTPVYRANVAFRAAFVPQGHHEVRFQFQSLSLRLGLLISGVSAALMFGAFIWTGVSARRARLRPRALPSG